MRLIIVILIIFQSLALNVFANFCTVNIDDIPKIRDPIYIKNNDLHIPEITMRGTVKTVELKWGPNDIGRIVCTNKKHIVNKDAMEDVNDAKKIEINFKCQAGNKLVDINSPNPEINLKNIECSGNIMADVDRTKTKCGAGTILEVGFKHNREFFKYFEICYNYNSGTVMYTKHIIPGQAFKPKPTAYDRTGDFKKIELPYYTREGEPYTKSNQLKRFSNIVKNINSKDKAFDPKSFLARGHLTPVYDGVFPVMKRATMLYVNAAPEWQKVNACNWRRVEIIAQNIARTQNIDLNVITGVAGILKMPTKTTKKDAELFLTTRTIQNEIIEGKKHKPNAKGVEKETQENLIPVPKYFWKVLQFGGKSIAFITLNNPHANPSSEEKICDDICIKYNYPIGSASKGFLSFTSGRTYCCRVSELVQKFPNDVPNELKFLKEDILKYDQNFPQIPDECPLPTLI